MLEQEPDTFLATGYPFDVPEPGAGLLSYCVLAYHLPLIIVFSLGRRALNVWGGCMLLRAEAFRSDRLGFLQVRCCAPDAFSGSLSPCPVQRIIAQKTQAIQVQLMC
jgi:hypothetical protein